MHAIGGQAKKWRVLGFTLATSLALLSGVSATSAPAHAAPAQSAVQGASTNHRTIAQEQAFLRSIGANFLADHLKRFATPAPTPNPAPQWSLATTKGSWGGYISDTTNQTNTNADYACYTMDSSSNNTYHTATWVGIGGRNGNKYLLQTGIDLANKEAWWEEVPGPSPSYASISAQVGDVICSDVARVGVGEWDPFTEDATSGVILDPGQQGFSPDHTTAEWVMEYQGYGINNVPSLGSNEPFTDAWFEDINYSQHNVAYAQTYYQSELGYTSGSGTCIKAGTLTNDTSTYSHFTDSWSSSGC